MRKRRVNLIATKDAVERLLECIGEDIHREGLRDTPLRYARFMHEWLEQPAPKFTVFKTESMSELVVQRNIAFYSLCEHHLLPFFGTAVVGYMPGKKLVGLSKLARAVQYCARGPQNQERITLAVADMLQAAIAPAGVGVVLRARHLCMEMRGVKAPGAESVTSCFRGSLRRSGPQRAEFLALAKDGQR